MTDTPQDPIQPAAPAPEPASPPSDVVAQPPAANTGAAPSAGAAEPTADLAEPRAEPAEGEPAAEPAEGSEGAEEAEDAKPAKKPKGPIRWGMLVGIVILSLGSAITLYVVRNRLLHSSVVLGGQRAFVSNVTLGEADLALKPAASTLRLGKLQIPDRNDPNVDLFALESFSAEVRLAELAKGIAHFAHAKAKGVGILAPRETPAEPLPGPEPQPAGEAAPEGLNEQLRQVGERAGIQVLSAKDMTFEELLEKADLETVKWARGLPERIAAQEKLYATRLAECRAALTGVTAQSKQLAPQVPALAKEITTGWNQRLGAKRQTFEELKVALEKDSKACGPNPAVDVPKRVERELADLEAYRVQQNARAKKLNTQVDALSEDLAARAKTLAALRKDLASARKTLETEIANGRAASDKDYEKIRAELDPGAAVGRLVEAIIGPALAKQGLEAKDLVATLKRLLPSKDRRQAVMRSVREGMSFEFLPEGFKITELVVDDLEITGTIHLSGGRQMPFEGHVRNLSNRPYTHGEIGFELAGQLEGRALQVSGTVDPAKDDFALTLRWTEPLAGFAVREGKLPLKLQAGSVTLTTTIRSNPERFALSLDADFKGLAWESPEGQEEKVLEAIRASLAKIQDLHLVIDLEVPAEGDMKLVVSDRSEPKLEDVLKEGVSSFAEEEVERQLGPHKKSLDALLVKECDAAQSKLGVSFGALSTQASGLSKEQSQASSDLDTEALDEATASQRGEEDLKKEATRDLLRAATKGKLKLPTKLPFGR